MAFLSSRDSTFLSLRELFRMLPWILCQIVRMQLRHLASLTPLKLPPPHPIPSMPHREVPDWAWGGSFFQEKENGMEAKNSQTTLPSHTKETWKMDRNLLPVVSLQGNCFDMWLLICDCFNYVNEMQQQLITILAYERRVFCLCNCTRQYYRVAWGVATAMDNLGSCFFSFLLIFICNKLRFCIPSTTVLHSTVLVVSILFPKILCFLPELYWFQ